jgi:hypothetical protein
MKERDYEGERLQRWTSFISSVGMILHYICRELRFKLWSSHLTLLTTKLVFAKFQRRMSRTGRVKPM